MPDELEVSKQGEGRSDRSDGPLKAGWDMPQLTRIIEGQPQEVSMREIWPLTDVRALSELRPNSGRRPICSQNRMAGTFTSVACLSLPIVSVR